MKKIILLFSITALSFSAGAQVYPMGASPYTETFDAIGGGISAAHGWSVYEAAGPNFLGTLSSFVSLPGLPSYLQSDSSCAALVLTGGFKNFPSADVCHKGDDWCLATPPSYTDRALGVRQVSLSATHPILDSGAAFVFRIANTSGMSAITMDFKLQSLDTSTPRLTTWQVDYAVGSSTTFTPATIVSGYFKTGGRVFSDTVCTVSFPASLSNQSLPVTFRIVTLLYSSSIVGTGTRASTAIDDFNLRWTGMATTAVTNVSANNGLDLTVLGNATSDNISFSYGVETEGDYTLAIHDMSGRLLHNQTIAATPGTEKVSVNGLNLASGLYIAKLSNGNSSAVAKISVQ